MGEAPGAGGPAHEARPLQPRLHRTDVGASPDGWRRSQLRPVVPHQPERMVRTLDRAAGRGVIGRRRAPAVGFVVLVAAALAAGAARAEVIAEIGPAASIGWTDNASQVTDV